MMAALHHSAVTQVLTFSHYGLGSQVMVSWTAASAHVLCLPSIVVQGFHTYLGISDPWILGSGSAGTGCQDASEQCRVEMKLNRSQVESTRQGRVNIQIA